MIVFKMLNSVLKDNVLCMCFLSADQPLGK